MKSSEILGDAIVMLENNLVYFLCHSIWVAVNEEAYSDQSKAHCLISWIDRQLYPHSSLNDWLKEEHGITLKGNRMKNYRIMWANKLKKICESEGD